MYSRAAQPFQWEYCTVTQKLISRPKDMFVYRRELRLSWTMALSPAMSAVEYLERPRNEVVCSRPQIQALEFMQPQWARQKLVACWGRALNLICAAREYILLFPACLFIDGSFG
jgi:hypothetical protein